MNKQKNKTSKAYSPMPPKPAEDRLLAGLTLVELMVGIAVFAFIVAIVSGLFVTAVRLQRRALAQQELVDQVGYLMEYMSRALRTARKELSSPPFCLSQRGLNYEITPRGGIRFINAEGGCQEFFLDAATKQLKELQEGVENVITSPSLAILTFRPVLAGNSQDDDLQPRVTFLFEVQRIGKKPEEQARMRIQTTISQRNLDITQ